MTTVNTNNAEMEKDSEKEKEALDEEPLTSLQFTGRDEEEDATDQQKEETVNTSSVQICFSPSSSGKKKPKKIRPTIPLLKTKLEPRDDGIEVGSHCACV